MEISQSQSASSQCSVIVFNIGDDVTLPDIMNIFRSAGTVTLVRYVKKNVAQIVFKYPHEADKAVSMHDAEFVKGRHLAVIKGPSSSQPQSASSQCSVIVFNIQNVVTLPDIMNIFASAGTVTLARYVKENIAEVVFLHPHEADNAVRMHDAELVGGRRLVIIKGSSSSPCLKAPQSKNEFAIRVTNFDKSISVEEIVENFADIGKLSVAEFVESGVAVLVYSTEEEAEKAIKEFDGCHVGDKALQVGFLPAQALKLKNEALMSSMESSKKTGENERLPQPYITSLPGNPIRSLGMPSTDAQPSLGISPIIQKENEGRLLELECSNEISPEQSTRISHSPVLNDLQSDMHTYDVSPQGSSYESPLYHRRNLNDSSNLPTHVPNKGGTNRWDQPTHVPNKGGTNRWDQPTHVPNKGGTNRWDQPTQVPNKGGTNRWEDNNQSAKQIHFLEGEVVKPMVANPPRQERGALETYCKRRAQIEDVFFAKSSNLGNKPLRYGSEGSAAVVWNPEGFKTEQNHENSSDCVLIEVDMMDGYRVYNDLGIDSKGKFVSQMLRDRDCSMKVALNEGNFCTIKLQGSPEAVSSGKSIILLWLRTNSYYKFKVVDRIDERKVVEERATSWEMLDVATDSVNKNSPESLANKREQIIRVYKKDRTEHLQAKELDSHIEATSRDSLGQLIINPLQKNAPGINNVNEENTRRRKKTCTAEDDLTRPMTWQTLGHLMSSLQRSAPEENSINEECAEPSEMKEATETKKAAASTLHNLSGKVSAKGGHVLSEHRASVHSVDHHEPPLGHKGSHPHGSTPSKSWDSSFNECKVHLSGISRNSDPDLLVKYFQDYPNFLYLDWARRERIIFVSYATKDSPEKILDTQIHFLDKCVVKAEPFTDKDRFAKGKFVRYPGGTLEFSKKRKR